MRAAARVMLAAAAACAGCDAGGRRVLYTSDAFTVTDTSVEQDGFRAFARSRDRIVSNYERAATEVNFKFSLDGLENEFPPGTDRMIYLVPRDGRIVTPVYTFGELAPPDVPAPGPATETTEEGPVDVTFRLDLRHVLGALRTQGSYRPPAGPPITAGGFEGVYVIGNTAPLSWDFARLEPGAPVELLDPDGDGVYAVTLRFEADFARPLTGEGLVEWRRARDIDGFPASTSPQRLPDALYRLALEEIVDLTRRDGAIDAGARWPDVWTRDLAWQTLLGLVFAAPDAVRAGLLARVDATGRIIQDSGTGGSWPISTDRMTWALAAWELYALQGDTTWLREAYGIIRRSAEADLAVARDTATGLFLGESTFLDWRDQSYPAWMEPADIFRGQALGTNALHYGAYRVLERMAEALGEPSERWQSVAEEVRSGVERYLWQANRGYHAQYRYGRLHMSLSPRAEHLGGALAAVVGLADASQRASSVERMPVVPFGVPSFWPYQPEPPPYHNRGVWPQVIGFRAWAAADAGNTAAVEHALANLYRASALFLTHKENWVASTGHFEGTEVNSDRFGASVAAQLATVYRVLFGMRLEPDRLVFRPLVPPAWRGTRTLSGLRYRGAVLDVSMHGYGDAVRRVLLDGEEIARAEVPGDLVGAHALEITLDGDADPGRITLVENVASPATPVARLEGERLVWDPVAGAERYVVVRNGEVARTVTEPEVPVAELAGGGSGGSGGPGRTPEGDRRDMGPSDLVEYQVMALGAGGLESFLSAPVRAGDEQASTFVEPSEPPLRHSVEGYRGNGYADVRDDTLAAVTFAATLPTAGLYALDVRYANGYGAVSYGERAAVRTVLVDGRPAGAVVLPQRGIGLWSEWGYGSPVLVRLERGAHRIALEYRPEDRNMDGQINGALIDHLRITRVGPPDAPPRGPAS